MYKFKMRSDLIEYTVLVGSEQECNDYTSFECSAWEQQERDIIVLKLEDDDLDELNDGQKFFTGPYKEYYTERASAHIGHREGLY